MEGSDVLFIVFRLIGANLCQSVKSVDIFLRNLWNLWFLPAWAEQLPLSGKYRGNVIASPEGAKQSPFRPSGDCFGGYAASQ